MTSLDMLLVARITIRFYKPYQAITLTTRQNPLILNRRLPGKMVSPSYAWYANHLSGISLLRLKMDHGY